MNKPETKKELLLKVIPIDGVTRNGFRWPEQGRVRGGGPMRYAGLDWDMNRPESLGAILEASLAPGFTVNAPTTMNPLLELSIDQEDQFFIVLSLEAEASLLPLLLRRYLKVRGYTNARDAWVKAPTDLFTLVNKAFEDDTEMARHLAEVSEFLDFVNEEEEVKDVA